MASRICSAPGCANMQPCPVHARKPYARATKYVGGRAWQRTRDRILARDGGTCQLRRPGCTILADVVDHVLNRARGGSDDDSNLVAACRACNESKRRIEAHIGRSRGRMTLMGGAMQNFRSFSAEGAGRPISYRVRVFGRRVADD